MQGDFAFVTQKWARMLVKTGKAFVHFCNDDTNERGLKLLEFATFNDLVLTNTFGHHKTSSLTINACKMYGTHLM